MKRFLHMVVYIMTIVNTLDPFYRTVWVNIEADNIKADSAEESYRVTRAVESALFNAMLFVLGNHSNDNFVHTLDVEIEAKANTHEGKLARTVFPTDTAAETDPEPAALCTYSPEVEQYIYHFLDDVRADISEMLKALATAHFEDTDGGEGASYAVTRRNVTPEP